MRDLFSARLIDARVLACKPLVDALIREASAGPYPPPPGGILDLASAWRAFLKNLLKQEIPEINFPELLRWTARKPPSDLTLSQLANDYYTEGGFVEWARNLVAESDPNPRVKESLRATVESIDAWWSLFQGCFAERLKQWAEQNSDLNGVLRIEEVLHDVVGPVAKQQPVLLIVLDGMSMAAFRELLANLLRRNWAEAIPPGGIGSRPVLATIPSVTEISRRALLSGQLPVATEGTEKSDFARNQRLFEQVGGTVKPQLFLKGDPMESGRLGLSAAVSESIAGRQARRR